MDRRAFIAAGACAVGAASTNSNVAFSQPTSLSAQAQRTGRFYGAAVRLEQLLAEPDLRAEVLLNCSHLTPETGLKWAVIEPRRGELNFADIDDLASFAQQHGKRLRGHTLVWHQSVPPWANETLQTSKDWAYVSRYFSSVIPRFGATINQWDVVNEPLWLGQREDGLRDSIFLRAFGPDYIARAFHEARTFTPDGVLILNEFNLEYDDSDQVARRRLLLKLLEGLKHAGVPIDGVGLQSHLDLRRGSVSEPELTHFIKEINGLGLSVTVTELDVKEAEYTAPVERRDQLVADEVRRYLDIVLTARHLTGIATWGLSDRHSWLEVEAGDYARFPGAWRNGGGPGLNRGLPFDTYMHRKLMYYSIQSTLSSAKRDGRRQLPNDASAY
jgi:endo-1,4-beta-xylanase